VAVATCVLIFFKHTLQLSKKMCKQ
jgi:hypothetical protein